MQSSCSQVFLCLSFSTALAQTSPDSARNAADRDPAARDPDKDRAEITALEQEWLHATDAGTLERILAADFVHVIPFDHFLTKQEHIDWVVKHPRPETGIRNSTN